MRIFFLVAFSITTNALAQDIPEMPYENAREHKWSKKNLKILLLLNMKKSQQAGDGVLRAPFLR